MLDLREDREGTLIRVRVLPRSSSNCLAGTIGGALKVKLTAPPVEGEANEACLKLMAEKLGVPRRSLELVSGHAGRSKTVRVIGLSAPDVAAALKSEVPGT